MAGGRLFSFAFSNTNNSNTVLLHQNQSFQPLPPSSLFLSSSLSFLGSRSMVSFEDEEDGEESMEEYLTQPAEKKQRLSAAEQVEFPEERPKQILGLGQHSKRRRFE